MLLFFLIAFAGVAKGMDFSKCFPTAKEDQTCTQRNFNNSRLTPVRSSIMFNDTDTTFRFLSEMANSIGELEKINDTDRQGMTLLHWAALMGNVDIVEKLLCFGIDVNAVDNEGNTPLHLAAQSFSSDTVQKLIISGGDVNAKNSYGKTPLHLAIKEDVFSVVLTLLAYGAKTDIVDNDGKAALDLATAIGNAATIKSLKAIGAKPGPKPELYKWTDVKGAKNLVVGGSGGNSPKFMYVGRVHHEGNIIPAKVSFRDSAAYADYNGERLTLSVYELLDSEHVAWKRMNVNMEIPHDAVVGGRTKDGEVLYIGRAIEHFVGQPILSCGQVSSSDKRLRTIIFIKEYTFDDYEILIQSISPQKYILNYNV